MSKAKLKQLLNHFEESKQVYRNAEKDLRDYYTPIVEEFIKQAKTKEDFDNWHIVLKDFPESATRTLLIVHILSKKDEIFGTNSFK